MFNETQDKGYKILPKSLAEVDDLMRSSVKVRRVGEASIDLGIDMSVIQHKDQTLLNLDSQLDLSPFEHLEESKSDDDIVLGEVANFYQSLQPVKEEQVDVSRLLMRLNQLEKNESPPSSESSERLRLGFNDSREHDFD